jgi:hypothetical protein
MSFHNVYKYAICLSICLCLWLCSPFVGPGPLFQFLDLFIQSVELLGWGSARRKATTYTHRTAQTHNKRKQTSMPLVGFEPTIPVFERANTVHALDRAATAIGLTSMLQLNKLFKLSRPFILSQ